MDISTFEPSTSVHSAFETVLPEPKDHLEWSIGALASYAHQPVRRQRYIAGEDLVEDTYPVELRTALDLSVALGLFGVAELGLAIPLVAFQQGEGAVPPDDNGGGNDLQRFGIGDPRLEAKARFLEAGPLELGAGLSATAPVGHYASSGKDFLGTTTPTVEPKLLGALGLGPIFVALNAGFLVRPYARMGEYEQNHALTWNAAVGWDVVDYHEPGGLRLAVETNGEAGIDFDTLAKVPMEALVGVKYRTSSDLILAAGGGPGISTAVGTPAFRVFIGVGYDSVLRSCPEGEEDFDGFEDDDKCIDPDNDQDGILDGEDTCPDDAEDVDEYQDDDGCPDDDNDGDTIPDLVDTCPMIPEDVDQFEDEDGCPEEGPGKPTVKITDTQLLISSKIYFDFNKASIKEVSHPILDAVAEALLSNPHIALIRVEGHTDNEGTEEYNLTLSKDRAKVVVDYLVEKNVPIERLTYEGYGFTRPKASNRTEEGRAINRRVEFTILKKE